MINCKVELKLKWTKSCVLAAAGADNADAIRNNFISISEDTKLCVTAVTLSAKGNREFTKTS